MSTLTLPLTSTRPVCAGWGQNTELVGSDLPQSAQQSGRQAGREQRWAGSHQSGRQGEETESDCEKVPQGEDPKTDPKVIGGALYPCWPENLLVSSSKVGVSLERGRSEFLYWYQLHLISRRSDGFLAQR
ncbi:hypothetical protein AMECASPLE_015378 [Ameca splendens]|uniref:Uncharacterized protein n=1 Tax=Ameca splendens TaxID=208324 RepID=A0ABV0XEY9_9TELE